MIPMLCSMFNIVFKIQKIGKTKLNLYRGMQPGGVETLIKILLGYPLMIFIKSERARGTLLREKRCYMVAHPGG